MELANLFTYEGKLKCQSEKIANSAIEINLSIKTTVRKLTRFDINKI